MMVRKVFNELVHDPIILLAFTWLFMLALAVALWIQIGEVYWVVIALILSCLFCLVGIAYSFSNDFRNNSEGSAKARRVTLLITLLILISLTVNPLLIVKSDNPKSRHIGLSYQGNSEEVILGVGNLANLYRFWQSRLFGCNIRWFCVRSALLDGEDGLSLDGSLGSEYASFEVSYSYSFNIDNLGKLKTGKNGDFNQIYRSFKDNLRKILDNFATGAKNGQNVSVRLLEDQLRGASDEFYTINSIKAKIRLMSNDTWIE